MIIACKTVIMNDGDEGFIVHGNKKYIRLFNKRLGYNQHVNYKDIYKGFQTLPDPTIIYTFMWKNYYNFIIAYDWEKIVILTEDEMMIKDIIE